MRFPFVALACALAASANLVSAQSTPIPAALTLAEAVRMLAERVVVFNQHAGRAGLSYPRYRGGFFVSVFTPDPEVTATVARERGVFVVPIQGAVRVALCSTSAAQVPELVRALVAGLEAARR